MLHKKADHFIYCITELTLDMLCSDLLQGLHGLAEAFGNATFTLSESAMCSLGAEGYLAGVASLLLATQSLPLRSIYC